MSNSKFNYEKEIKRNFSRIVKDKLLLFLINQWL